MENFQIEFDQKIYSFIDRKEVFKSIKESPPKELRWKSCLEDLRERIDSTRTYLAELKKLIELCKKLEVSLFIQKQITEEGKMTEYGSGFLASINMTQQMFEKEKSVKIEKKLASEKHKAGRKEDEVKNEKIDELLLREFKEEEIISLLKTSSKKIGARRKLLRQQNKLSQTNFLEKSYHDLVEEP